MIEGESNIREISELHRKRDKERQIFLFFAKSLSAHSRFLSGLAVEDILP
jgi:hypothetical protein